MSWINEAAIKRRSQFSTFIVFETIDPLRVNQFLHFLRESDHHRAFNIPENSVEMLLYDPWEGLKDISTGRQMKTDGESPLSAPDARMKLVENVVAVNGYPAPGEVVNSAPLRIDEPPELDPQGSAPCQLDPALVPGHPIDLDEPLELHGHQRVVEVL